jgi:hypothetical protein
MKLWWLGWTSPKDIPDDHVLAKWPSNMQGWRTGEGDDHLTWVGAIWAETAGDAWTTVLSCYGESAGRVVERFEPDLKPDDWRPTDRFPNFNLVKP